MKVTSEVLRENAQRVQDFLTRSNSLTPVQKSHIADRIQVMLFRDECRLYNIPDVPVIPDAPLPWDVRRNEMAS